MNKKKLVAILTLLCFMFTLMPVAAMAAETQDTVILKIGSTDIYKNGVKMTTDVPPTIVDGRTLVPVRVIIEALGGDVDWDETTRTVTISIDGKVLKLVIDKEIPGYGTGAMIIDGRTMVPIRYISEYVGYEVKWIEATQQVIITRTTGEAETTYTVSFDLNTGSEGVYKTVTVEEGQTVEKPDVEHKSGRVFHGWYTNDEGKGEPFDFSTPIYSDLTLYGHWSSVSYGGGSGSSAPSAPSHNHEYNYTANNNGTHVKTCNGCSDVNVTEKCTKATENECVCGTYFVSNNEELSAAISAGKTNIYLQDGNYTMPDVAKGKAFTITGSEAGKVTIKVVPAGQGEANGQLDYSLDGSTVTFNNVTIETNSQLYAGYARLSATYNDCVIQNTYNLGTGNSEFNNCTFNITNEYLRVGGAYSAVFNGCTFNTDGRAILVFQDGTSVAQTVTVNNCTFNATAAAKTWNGIHVAAVSIDGSQGGTYVVNLIGENTVDSNFNGLWQIKAEDENVTISNTVSTADELVEAFTNLEAGDVIYIGADIDMTGKTITPVTGNKAFTMYGNGYTISNLESTAAALFVDHSGSSAYAFDGVNLKNCSVNSTTNYGALFVGDGDTSDAITITNCHVENCTVISAKYAAAFVAYTAGYDVQNNGPVYSDVTITDCSVTGSSITGGGSVGAAIGHAGGNPDTTNTITNFEVNGVTINGEDTEHTGIVVGTANVGKTIINDVTYNNVKGNYNTTTQIYGRFVPNTTGTLEIDGASVVNSANV